MKHILVIATALLALTVGAIAVGSSHSGRAAGTFPVTIDPASTVPDAAFTKAHNVFVSHGDQSVTQPLLPSQKPAIDRQTAVEIAMQNFASGATGEIHAVAKYGVYSNDVQQLPNADHTGPALDANGQPLLAYQNVPSWGIKLFGPGYDFPRAGTVAHFIYIIVNAADGTIETAYVM